MRKFDDCQFDFAQFGKYLQNMHSDLLAIKKYYCEYFNTNSKVDIDTYIKNFDSYVMLIKNILYDKDKYKDYKQRNINANNYEISARLFKNNVATFDYVPSDTDFYDSPNTAIFFNEDIYEILNNIVNKIFVLEDDVSKITIPIWNKTLTNVKDFDGKNPYRLLVKVLSDWRIFFNKGEKYNEAVDYLDKRIGCSLSYVTNEQSLFFKSNRGAYGIVYSLNDGFIAGNSKDAYLDEFINDECPQDVPTLSMNPIRQIYFENGNSVQANATKIATPNGVLFENGDRFNEIIADKRKITPVATFYIASSVINGAMQELVDMETTKLQARNLAKKLNVPVIELNQFEKVNEIQSKICNKDVECLKELT